ncbi:MAG: aldehyde dehydrogenase family protein [Pigmentiphaga sp.]|uniref:aldehyde dehydrogenase family protein n=1 Tax=Pigmentiphaga sp. TaxID=1977564 RepID=UPI003B545750
MSASTKTQTLAALQVRPVCHVIDGRLVGSERSADVIDPATGQPFGRCPQASPDQLDAAVAAARRAQPAWAARPLAERRNCLHRLADAILAHEPELAALITLEQGKPLKDAHAEVARAASQIRLLTELVIETEVVRDDARGRVELRYRPLGVVGAITPWNMPLVLSVPKIAHALYTGNVIVLKPSPYAPLATLRLGELAHDLFPPGVLNVLAGDHALGQHISEHPGIDKISFTGSIATGKRVMASAAGTLKRVTLELGGNDAAIVLDDVDPEAIAPKLFAGAFVNCGQVCMAIKRLYVHADIYEPLVDALGRIARATRVGNGFDPDVQLGPVQNLAQFKIVQDILDDTRRAGARFVAGGHALEGGQGYFIEPTIVADITEGTRLVDEEPFGPVLPVIRFTDVDDALSRANSTRFGLGGSVWSRNVERAAAIAARLEAGTAWVNHHVGADAQVPFGGAKQSGRGREYGKAGLREYMEEMAVFIPSSRL